jgi:hypothetical protein
VKPKNPFNRNSPYQRKTKEVGEEPYWKKQEASTAKDMQGKLTPCSGSKSIKGDVMLPACRIECKSTRTGAYTLNLKKLLALELHSMGALNPVPSVYQVDFVNPNDDTLQKRVYVIPNSMYERFEDFLKQESSEHE